MRSVGLMILNTGPDIFPSLYTGDHSPDVFTAFGDRHVQGVLASGRDAVNVFAKWPESPVPLTARTGGSFIGV